MTRPIITEEQADAIGRAVAEAFAPLAAAARTFTAEFVERLGRSVATAVGAVTQPQTTKEPAHPE